MELVYYIRKPGTRIILDEQKLEDKEGYSLVKFSKAVPYAVVVSNGYSSVGYSICSHNDIFSKKKGLMIARAREANGFSLDKVPDFMLEHINIMLEKSRRAFRDK